MRIGIIGYGFVGQAVRAGFDMEDNDFLIHDPAYKKTITIPEVMIGSPQVIFVCVPTPPMNVVSIDSGNTGEFDRCDTSIVKSVLNSIGKHKSHASNPIVCIKSTVPPSFFIGDYEKDYGLDIVYNPEFLREQSNVSDFINCDLIVLGGDPNWCEMVASFYRKRSLVNLCPFYITSARTASLFKYTLNAFLALKISFFNQIYTLFQTIEATAEEYSSAANKKRDVQLYVDFVQALMQDHRMGPSHMQVPGTDDNFGFGGKCLPKDTKALMKEAEDLQVMFTILKSAIDYNKLVREDGT
jgi:UDPglucose 6-dehydrogenase